MLNADQRVTAHLGLQTEMEDIYERSFPALNKLPRYHREILVLIYQGGVSGTQKSAEQFDQLVIQELNISQNTVDNRLKNLKDLGLIEWVSSSEDGRVFFPKLTTGALHGMQQVGDHMATCIFHYATLIQTRGPIPKGPAPDGLYDPVKKET
jgi:hypothetical protein